MPIPKPTETQLRNLSLLIKKILQEENLYIENFGLMLGVTYQAIAQWRDGKGRPVGQSKIQLLKYLGVNESLYEAYLSGSVSIEKIWERHKNNKEHSFNGSSFNGSSTLKFKESSGTYRAEGAKQLSFFDSPEPSSVKPKSMEVEVQDIVRRIDSMQPQEIVLINAAIARRLENMMGKNDLAIKSFRDLEDEWPAMSKINFSYQECERLRHLIIVSADEDGLNLVNFWSEKNLRQGSYSWVIAPSIDATETLVPIKHLDAIYPHLYKVREWDGFRPILRSPRTRFSSSEELVRSIKENGAACLR